MCHNYQHLVPKKARVRCCSRRIYMCNCKYKYVSLVTYTSEEMEVFKNVRCQKECEILKDSTLVRLNFLCYLSYTFFIAGICSTEWRLRSVIKWFLMIPVSRLTYHREWHMIRWRMLWHRELAQIPTFYSSSNVRSMLIEISY